MLVFYPEFEAEQPDEVEVLFYLDASCSMKVDLPDIKPWSMNNKPVSLSFNKTRTIVKL
jgi:hypothetical protein